MDASELWERIAEYYLGNGPSLAMMLVANGVAFLLGIRYYAATLPTVPTLLFPLYGDSPTAVALASLSLATLLPYLGQRVRTRPTGRALAYLETVAVIWLVKTGLWTVVALNVPLVRPDLSAGLYVGFDPESLYAYWVIMLTHAAFVVEAGLIAYYARRTHGAVLLGTLLALGNDLYDYGFLLGLPVRGHPPIRYEPGWLLAGGSVLATAAAVVFATRSLRLLGRE